RAPPRTRCCRRIERFPRPATPAILAFPKGELSWSRLRPEEDDRAEESIRLADERKCRRFDVTANAVEAPDPEAPVRGTTVVESDHQRHRFRFQRAALFVCKLEDLRPFLGAHLARLL